MNLFNLAGFADSLGWILLVGAAAAPVADLPRATTKPGGLSVSRDVQVTVQVKQAFSQDKELAQANLRVNVREGVAVLSGPASSAELIAKAIQKTKEVRGVLSVKSELYVSAPRQPPPEFVRPAPEPPTQTTSASPPREPAAAKLTTVVKPEAVSLLERIEKVRQSDRRYRLIRVEVEARLLTSLSLPSPRGTRAAARRPPAPLRARGGPPL